MGAPPSLSDHALNATPQWPAGRNAGEPSDAVTLKPSEQRAPSAKMASPPATNSWNSPEVRFNVATAPPIESTVACSLPHSCESILLSARTSIWFVFGLTDQAVTGIRASSQSIAVPSFTDMTCGADCSSDAYAWGSVTASAATAMAPAPAINAFFFDTPRCLAPNSPRPPWLGIRTNGATSRYGHT